MSSTEVLEQRGRVRFPGISPRAYEHPADRGAMAGLRALPGAAEMLKSISGLFPERGERLMALASCIRVGPRQYRQIAAIRDDCAAILDLPKVPDLFVMRSPDANAMAIGIDEPFVLITTGLVEAYDLDSLRFTIGHEIGHVCSEHAVLRTLLVRLLRMQSTMSWVPVGALGMRAVIAALLEWFRKAELTADRAGLLCGQDPAAALRAHVYLAGGTDLDQIDLPSFLQQADEYLHVGDIRDSIHKLRSVESMSHPLAVVRAAQLQQWAASEDYRAILGGTFARRDADKPQSDLGADLSGAAKSYRQSTAESVDPLMSVLSNIGEQVAKAGSFLGDAAGRVFGGGDHGRADGTTGEDTDGEATDSRSNPKA